jgi:hypothetical protein
MRVLSMMSWVTVASCCSSVCSKEEFREARHEGEELLAECRYYWLGASAAEKVQPGAIQRGFFQQRGMISVIDFC